MPNFPMKKITEIVEARFTDPAVTIGGGIAFMKHVGCVDQHELGPAKLAVIMVVARTRGSIFAMH